MTIQCPCGGTATLQSNAVIYGREYGNGKAYVCDKCKGYVGTHPDGRPLGTIPDAETRELRKKVHAVIDPLWKSGEQTRSQVYARISKAIGKQYHTGESDKETCLAVLRLFTN